MQYDIVSTKINKIKNGKKSMPDQNFKVLIIQPYIYSIYNAYSIYNSYSIYNAYGIVYTCITIHMIRHSQS